MSRKLKMLAKRLDVLRAALGEVAPLRILDVGANPISKNEYDELLELQGCELWGFEPQKSAYDKLVADAKPGTHFLNQAVGTPGPAQFYAYSHSGFSSLFPLRKSAMDYLGKPQWWEDGVAPVAMDLVGLDGIDDADLPKPDLLKIDIQGGELAVFQSGREKLNLAVCVIPEVRFYRLYDDEPMWSRCDVELEKQGFVLHKLLFAKDTVVGNSRANRMKSQAFSNQLIDGDAVYIRNPETIADWSDDQVIALLVAAAGVFDSHDLAVFCLDELQRRGRVEDGVQDSYLDALPAWYFREG